jgi:two-component system response regulator HydG
MLTFCMKDLGKVGASPRVLIADDDLEAREMLGMVFSGDGQACELVESGSAALECLSQRAFDVLICDVRMNGMSGLELLDRVKGRQPALPVIVITAMGAVHDAVDAVKRGAYQYVTKPLDVDQLRAMVTEAVNARTRSGEVESRGPLSRADAVDCQLVGLGPAMITLQKAITRVAMSSAPVLVTGETGVGKELVARAIHSSSDRRDQPFVAVNTSAVQEDLFESELFGHVRGAFTGAAQHRKGLLSEAHGGTLLLDEIGDMPMRLQSKLLRVVQFGEVRPVGSDREHHVDVRIIAATHRDLPALVREGRFRDDLYFRLNVLPISVPPLREHREDIPALALHFLMQALRRAARSPVRTIDEDALAALSEAPWPGNVRELASAIERAVVFSGAPALSLGDLSLAASTTEDETTAWPCTPDAPWTLRQLNQNYAKWVLRQVGGDKRRAAEILQVDLSTLYRWQRTKYE